MEEDEVVVEREEHLGSWRQLDVYFETRGIEAILSRR